jgi:uncharacterized protein YlaI
MSNLPFMLFCPKCHTRQVQAKTIGDNQWEIHCLLCNHIRYLDTNGNDISEKVKREAQDWA